MSCEEKLLLERYHKDRLTVLMFGKRRALKYVSIFVQNILQYVYLKIYSRMRVNRVSSESCFESRASYQRDLIAVSYAKICVRKKHRVYMI